MRKHYLDNIRWMTVVIVVIYHVFYMYNIEGVAGGLGRITSLNVQYYDLFLYVVYPWLMPILFIVSGISSRLYLEKHTEKEFIRSRTQKLLVPSTIGLFVFHFIQGYINMMLSDAYESMKTLPFIIRYLIMVLSGTGVLWYAQLLYVFSLFLLMIRKVEQDRLYVIGKKVNLLLLVLFTPLIWFSAQIGNTPVVVVYRFGLYGLMFLLGYFVFTHDEVIVMLKKNIVLLDIAALLLCVVFCILYFGQNYADAPINRSFIFTSYCWFGCLGILATAAKYFDLSSSFTGWMNAHNFGLYVFHYLGISAIALYMGKNGSYPPLLIYVLSLLAGFTAGYLLDYIISCIPFFRWAVLGKKRMKICLRIIWFSFGN